MNEYVNFSSFTPRFNIPSSFPLNFSILYQLMILSVQLPLLFLLCPLLDSPFSCLLFIGPIPPDSASLMMPFCSQSRFKLLSLSSSLSFCILVLDVSFKRPCGTSSLSCILYWWIFNVSFPVLLIDDYWMFSFSVLMIGEYWMFSRIFSYKHVNGLVFVFAQT